MQIGKMEDFTIDQFAGSMALILGSIGGLLMIIWKSRCKCSMNCCYFNVVENHLPMKLEIVMRKLFQNHLIKPHNNGQLNRWINLKSPFFKKFYSIFIFFMKYLKFLIFKIIVIT